MLDCNALRSNETPSLPPDSLVRVSAEGQVRERRRGEDPDEVEDPVTLPEPEPEPEPVES